MSNATATEKPLQQQQNPVIGSQILIGYAGAGKSYLIEKATGVKGLSSSSSTSYTQCARRYPLPDGSTIIDTPGCNASEMDLFTHNLWIAQAFNAGPVSNIIVVVEAHQRLETMFTIATQIVRRFKLGLDTDNQTFVLCVTKMDMEHEWSAEEVTRRAGRCFTNVIFSGHGVTQSALLHQLREVRSAATPTSIKIDDSNFFTMFDMDPHDIYVTKAIQDEIDTFSSIDAEMCEVLETMRKRSDEDHTDCVESDEGRELRYAWQLYAAEYVGQRISSFADEHPSIVNIFECIPSEEGTMSEKWIVSASHMGNLINGMNRILYNIRVRGFDLEEDLQPQEIDWRKCPYCGTVWEKVDGCDGSTRCGRHVFSDEMHTTTYYGYIIELIDSCISSTSSVIAKVVLPRRSKKKILSIRRASENDHETTSKEKHRIIDNQNEIARIGCGMKICWSNMMRVDPPNWCNHSPSSTPFVEKNPISENNRSTWRNYFMMNMAKCVLAD